MRITFANKENDYRVVKLLAETPVKFDRLDKRGEVVLVGYLPGIEVGQSIGTLNYTTVLVDVRRYFMPVRPVTVAVRGLQYSRWGRNREHERLAELYVGHPELIHGYGAGSFDAVDCRELDALGRCSVSKELSGSGLMVANLEVRAPVYGLFKGELDYGRVPVEIAGFFDAALVWSKDTAPVFAGGTRQIFRSAGLAVRVNAFGLAIVEVSAARAFNRGGGGWQWQVGLRQGF